MTQHQAQQRAFGLAATRYKITFAARTENERIEYGYFADDDAANRYARQTAGNRTISVLPEPQPGDASAPYGLDDPGAATVERITPDVPGEAVQDLFGPTEAPGLEAQDYVTTGGMLIAANTGRWTAGQIDEAEAFPEFGSASFAEGAIKVADEAYRQFIAFRNAGYDLTFEQVRSAIVGFVRWTKDGDALTPSPFEVKRLWIEDQPKPYLSYVYTRTLEISVPVTGRDKAEAIAHGHDFGLQTLIERGDVKVYAHTARLRS